MNSELGGDVVRWMAEFREVRALIAEIDAREERAVSLRNRLNRSVRTDYGLCRMIEDEERSLLHVRDCLVRRVERAERAIAALADPVGRSVLQMRYLLGLPWDRISDKLGYERTTLWRIHKRALAELAELEGGEGVDAGVGARKRGARSPTARFS